jgi:hypothetical protein
MVTAIRGLALRFLRVMTNILTSFRLVSLFHKLIGLIYVTGLHNFSSGMTTAMKGQQCTTCYIKFIVSRDDCVFCLCPDSFLHFHLPFFGNNK